MKKAELKQEIENLKNKLQNEREKTARLFREFEYFKINKGIELLKDLPDFEYSEEDIDMGMPYVKREHKITFKTFKSKT